MQEVAPGKKNVSQLLRGEEIRLELQNSHNSAMSFINTANPPCMRTITLYNIQ